MLERGWRRYLPHIRGMFAYGLGPALGLISGPILARALGPTGRGQFASVMEPLTLGGAVASIGLPAAATYFIASGKNRRQVLGNTLALGGLVALVTYLAMALYSGPVSAAQGLPRWLYLVAWASVLASAAIQILRGYWQGQNEMRRLDVERFTFAILRFMAVVILAVVGFRSAGSFVAGALLSFLLAGLILLSSRLFLPDRGVSVPRRSIYSYSLFASIGTIAVVASNRIDQVLLPLVSSSAHIGFYAVAVTIAEVPVIFAALAGRNALTLASQGVGLRKILTDIVPFLLIGALLAIALMFVSPFLIPMLFGTEFSPSITSVQILSVGTLFSFVAFVSIAITAGWRRPLLSSMIPVAGLFVTFIGFRFTGHGVTSEGASWISFASQAAAAGTGCLVLFSCWRRRNRSRDRVPEGA